NRRYDEVNLALSKEERKAGTIMGSVNPIMTLLMNLGITAVVAVSAYTVQKGISTPATVIAFVQYFTLISMAMMVISRIFVMYTKCAASANRIAEVLETPDKFFVTEDSSESDSENFITFENVSFSYLGKKNNIDDFSVSVPKGGTLGIIGATGSGKSTFVKLLMRSYEANSGSIKINGRDITSYDRKELTEMFGVALQNDFLFADTIHENIAFGRELSDEDIKRAAKIAQAEEFIEALPEKYEHVIAPKGTNLSGGQRQRLLIARAVATKPDIIILDDSSSALDYKTDAALRKALDTELSGSTVITVAQRVSSVKNCGIILVLDNGKIIGKGTHEELLESCSEYKEISDSQMGGAFVD
ncbi:MAG: ABC transporter ATP-binding protein, partial [Oscillospiraceae bacterium]|nr:ABC transporter ATP-binding protein [Oscillospiraceae bacterium]